MMNNTSIGAIVSTSSQISTAGHNTAKVALAIPRAAFIALIRLNVWGLATLISKRAFLVDAATTATQKAPNMWWDLQAKWRNAWWNIGGNWDEFVSAVNAGKGKKALGFKLAPAGIKTKLKEQGIGSYSALGSIEEQGIGITLEAGIAAASAIIALLLPLLTLMFDNVKKDIPASDFEEAATSTTSSTEASSSMAGAGLIGVAALAAIYFGTMSKK